MSSQKPMETTTWWGTLKLLATPPKQSEDEALFRQHQLTPLFLILVLLAFVVGAAQPFNTFFTAMHHAYSNQALMQAGLDTSAISGFSEHATWMLLHCATVTVCCVTAFMLRQRKQGPIAMTVLCVVCLMGVTTQHFTQSLVHDIRSREAMFVCLVRFDPAFAKQHQRNPHPPTHLLCPNTPQGDSQ